MTQTRDKSDAKPDLQALYRPIGIAAVLAAARMIAAAQAQPAR